MLIALSLMSFVLVIVLSLILMASVETANAANAKDRLLARENARLGLMIALGELQKHAGPDQRVTARAELLGETGDKQFWTGIWPSNGGAPPVWLVSSADGLPSGPSPGLVEDPSLPDTAARRMRIQQSNKQAAPAAEVALIGINANRGAKAGSYAFWVDDDGVKSDLRVIGDEPVFPEQNFLNNPGNPGDLSTSEQAELRSRLLQTNPSAQFSRIFNEFVSNGDFQQWERETAVGLRKLSSFESLDSFFADDPALDLPANLSSHVTLGSFGVLADTRDGGLRTNLESALADVPGSSDPFRNGDLARFVDIERNFTDFTTAAYGNQRGLRGFTESGGTRIENFATGATGGTGSFPRLPTPAAGEFRAFHHLSPIITEFMIVCAVYQGPDNNPALRYFVDLELHNPYPFPLLLNGDNKHALSVFVTGLPEIQIIQSQLTADDSMVEIRRSPWIDLNDVPAAAGGARDVSSWLQIADSSASRTGPAYLLPGETYRLQEPNPSWQPGGLRKNLGNTPSNVADEAFIKLIARSTDPDAPDEGRLNVRLVRGSRFSGGTPLPGGSVESMPSLFEIRNVPYTADFEYDFGGRNADGRSPGVPERIPGPGGRPVPNPDFTQSERKYLADLRFSGSTNVTDAYSFAIHFSLGGNRAFGSPNVAQDGFPDLAAELLRFWDLRNPIIDYEASYSYRPRAGEPEVTLPLSTLFSSGSDDPIETLTDLSLFNLTQRFSDNAAGSDLRLRDQRLGNFSDVRLFDVPLTRPTTVAGFRHAFFVNSPPLSLTSPWGGALNDAFDRYFLSSVPETGWEPSADVPLPNPRMTLLNTNATPSTADLRAPDSASNFLVAGAFNINSTSVEAWRAALSQDFPSNGDDALDRADFRNREYSSFFVDPSETTGFNPGLDSNPPKNYFARFNFAALSGFLPERTDADLFTLPATSTREGLQGQATRQGIRILGSDENSLPEREGNLTLQHLAFHIVRLLKERFATTGSPFMTLSEFIQSGLLQDAIDAVGPGVSASEHPSGTALAAVTPINQGLSGFEPTYLLQSDLITALSGFFLARSDTFTIRSYGDARDPITGAITGNVMIEAKVQRFPDPVAGSNSSSFERSFRVLSTRFISL